MNQELQRILLVEDVRAEAVLLEGMLRSSSPHLAVTWVDRLGKAVEQLALGTFDAVLLDLSLPDERGLATLGRIQEAAGSVPVVILTGVEDEETAIRAIRQGAQDYLVKGTLDGRGVVRAIRYAIDRKRQEEDLRRLNRTLRALSKSSHAMMRAAEESELLSAVCRIVVEDCGHAMAWIGYAESDESRTVRPVAYAGFEEGYLETLQVSWADTVRGRGPTGTAIRTGAPYICRNMLTDPCFEPWRKEAMKRGYASSISIPLMDGDRAFGALMIYARIPDPFSESEVQLLGELAGDLAYGIMTLRTREAKARLLSEKEALSDVAQRRADELAAVFEAITDGVIVQSLDGAAISANPAAVKDLGFDPVAEGVEGLRRKVRLWDALGREIEPESLLDSLLSSEEPLAERRFLMRNAEGRELAVLATAAPLQTGGQPSGSVLVWHDITRQERTERALRRALERAKAGEAEVTALLESTKAVLEHEAFEGAAKAIEGSCRAIIGAQKGFFALIPKQWRGERDLLPGILHPVPEIGLPFPRAVASCLNTMLVKRSAVLENALPTPREESREAAGLAVFENVLLAPMVFGSRCLGFLGLADKPGGFKEDDLRTATAFAKIAVIAFNSGEAREQLRASLREKEVLLKEIHHRVKNNLQIIASMLNLQAVTIRDEEDRMPLIESQNRVRSLALIHEKLYGAADLSLVPFKDYVSDFAPFLFRTFQFASGPVRLRLDLEEVHLGVTSAIPLGLILNELISNALKHAFPGERGGEIEVGLRSPGSRVCELSVRDDGVGFPPDLDYRKTETLGLQLVCVLTKQLGGELEMRRDGGTLFRVTFEEAG